MLFLTKLMMVGNDGDFRGPDGSMKPNPFWVEIYEPKRRYKRSRPSMSK